MSEQGPAHAQGETEDTRHDRSDDATPDRLESDVKRRHPFDAVLMISFGGPQGPKEVRPFLTNVLRGRRVPPERIEEVAHHYELFNGVSPLTAITERQAAGVRQRLHTRGLTLPVYIGMRNWHPFLGDTLRQMAADGVRRAVGLILAAHRSYSSCGQYRDNVLQARAELRAAGLTPIQITYVNDWHLEPGYIDAITWQIHQARIQLSLAHRKDAHFVFTAHSIPESMPAADTYKAQLLQTAAMVAQRLVTKNWTLVFQSRSGRPEDPWVGPDVNGYLRQAKADGVNAVVVSPIGFVCDHIEVLFDLDVEARATADEIGLEMVRASSVNWHPHFLDALANAVVDLIEKYRGRRPLTIVSADAPNARELPPIITSL